jgi:hypothetical protein
MIATYVVAFSAMLFAALSALALSFTVNHFDNAPPAERESVRNAAA